MTDERPVPEPPEEPAPVSPVRLPPFPRGEDLVELDRASFERGVRVFLDPASLSQPGPGTVRYTVLIVSASGVGNLFYEGLHCGRKEWRTLAFGTREGKFEPVADPRWRTLLAGGPTGYRRALARTYVCTRERRTADRAEDLRRRLTRRGPLPGTASGPESNR